MIHERQPDLLELQDAHRARQRRDRGHARAAAGDVEIEIRQVFEADDFGPEFTPELREQEERLRAEIAAGRPVIGAGAGTGLSAKCAEAGGTDLIIIYNSGRYRMAGRGSLAGLLPYGDANAIVMEMGAEVLPIVRDTPVLAGVCGTDPFRLMPQFLRQVKEAGFAGVQNFPTVGLIDGTFRANLEETGMSYGLEVDMIREASSLGLLTSPYVFDPDQADERTQAGPGTDDVRGCNARRGEVVADGFQQVIDVSRGGGDPVAFASADEGGAA